MGGGQGSQLSTDDRLKIEELVDEVRDPSPSLTITQTSATVAITDSHARTRTFRTNGKKDKQQLDDVVTVNSKTKWEGPKLVTEYDLPGSRKLTYAYSLMPDTHQLLIEETLEGGSGSGKNPTVIKRVYDPAAAKS